VRRSILQFYKHAVQFCSFLICFFILIIHRINQCLSNTRNSHSNVVMLVSIVIRISRLRAAQCLRSLFTYLPICLLIYFNPVRQPRLHISMFRIAVGEEVKNNFRRMEQRAIYTPRNYHSELPPINLYIHTHIYIYTYIHIYIYTHRRRSDQSPRRHGRPRAAH